MAPVIPNNSIVHAKVEDISNTNINYVQLIILSSDNVQTLKNFTKGMVGKKINAYTRENISHIRKGDKIVAEIRYDGDEFGGRFNLSKIKTE